MLNLVVIEIFSVLINNIHNYADSCADMVFLFPSMTVSTVFMENGGELVEALVRVTNSQGPVLELSPS